MKKKDEHEVVTDTPSGNATLNGNSQNFLYGGEIAQFEIFGWILPVFF